MSNTETNDKLFFHNLTLIIEKNFYILKNAIIFILNC